MKAKKWYRVVSIHKDDAFFNHSYNDVPQVGDIVELVNHVKETCAHSGYISGDIRKKYARVAWIFFAIKLEAL